MGFFDMGPLEILLILVVALIIWGPAKIPEIARTLGRIVSTLKKATSDLTMAVTKELSPEEKDRPPSSRVNSDHKPRELPEPSGVDKAEPSSTETIRPGDQRDASDNNE